MDTSNPVKSAITLLGSEAKLAAAAGVTQVAIHKAKHRAEDGHPVSAELAVSIERATDGKIPRHVMRPDLWSAPSENGVAA